MSFGLDELIAISISVAHALGNDAEEVTFENGVMSIVYDDSGVCLRAEQNPTDRMMWGIVANATATSISELSSAVAQEFVSVCLKANVPVTPGDE